MNLVIDIGNTNIKHALFEDDELLKIGNSPDLSSLENLLSETSYERCIISSVKYGEDEIKTSLQGHSFTYFDFETPLPIKVNYSSPQTLGMDRLAAVIGARHKFPDMALMVIDIGTCITYDLLDEAGIYQGGAISPGIELKYKAVHDYTSRLPLINDRHDADLFGRSTYDSIKSGVLNGTLAEIEGMIGQFMLKSPDLKVIITGGGAKTFESKIKADIFVALEIVLVGLNRVLVYNAQEF